MNSTINKSRKYNFIDLFCGVGGFSYGLEQTKRFQAVLANDIDKDMCNAFALNFSKTKILSKSVTDIDFIDIKRKNKIDVIVGGPPCQAYSFSGKRYRNDPRGSLFLEYFRAVRDIRPQIFVYENVKGLTSYKNGFIFRQIRCLFQSIGYSLSINLINAQDFGVPQFRERIFVVGYKKNFHYVFPKASKTKNFNKKPLTISDAISDLPRVKSNMASDEYLSKPKNSYQKLMRLNAPKKLVEHYASKHNDKLLNLMRNLPEGGTKQDLPLKIRPKSGYQNSYARLWWNKPSTTITRNFGTPSSARCIHPKVDRALTTREGARLQSFPDNYKFYGSKAKKNLQIGNAVPPLLAKRIAESIYFTLDNS